MLGNGVTPAAARNVVSWRVAPGVPWFFENTCTLPNPGAPSTSDDCGPKMASWWARAGGATTKPIAAQTTATTRMRVFIDAEGTPKAPRPGEPPLDTTQLLCCRSIVSHG